jgi:murein DD-endopeptidase MepM/ murein hydrolase activator NlpD
MVSSFIMMILPVKAVTQTDIQMLEEKRAALEQQLSDQAEVVQSLAANHALIVDRKAALDKQIALNRESIELLEEQLAAYDELIAQKETDLSLAQKAEEEQTAAFRVRLRAMEETGDVSLYSYIFEADSFDQLLARLGDVSDIMHYDRQLETDLRQARAETERVKREYEQIHADQSAVYDELAGKKAELDAQVAAACALIANLNSRSEDAEKEYAAIEAAEQEAYKAEQEALAAYAAEQYAAMLAAQQAAAAQAAQVGGQSGYAGTYEATYGYGDYAATGMFIWPVDSTYITSGYGGRSSPTSGASSYHEAIDIGAAAGSPIYAAADGQVIVATYSSGLGNYVSIAHDGDTSTRYSHMTNYVVQPGEYVTQGQIIGYVGSTGIATGDHLDFAVTQGGQSVDPLQYYDQSYLTFDPTA